MASKRNQKAQRRAERARSAWLLQFSPAVRKQGTALLEQQMWCWGCDVRRDEGNLLLAYGFEKHPAPHPRYSSTYTCAVACGCSLQVWGFGMVYTHPALGSLFLRRGKFDPRWSAVGLPRLDVWSADDLPAFARPESRESCEIVRALLAGSIDEVFRYERWVKQNTESAYREHTVESWIQRRHFRGVPASEMMGAWARLVGDCRETPILYQAAQ